MLLWLLLFLDIFCCFPSGLSGQYLPDTCIKSCEVNVCNSECILPNLPPNGKYIVTGSAQGAVPVPGSKVRNSTVLYFTCNSGYRLVGSSTAICLESQWITDFSHCEKIKECILPKLPENGGYNIVGSPNQPNPGTEAKEWTALTYFCDSSFTLVGQMTAVCQSGQWSSNPPYCKRQKTHKCILPVPSQNGQYVILGSPNAPVPGQIVTDLTALSFTCSDSFTLIGESVVICSEGSWLGSFPTCSAGGNQKCVLPNFPQYGNYIVLGSATTPVPGSSVNDRDTLQFVCMQGYELIGKETSTCLSGEWTSDVPHCSPPKTDHCVVPNPPINGNYFLVGSVTPPIAGLIVDESSTLKFSCEFGFQLVGNSSSTCFAGKWTPEIPRCAETTKSCLLPDQPENGGFGIVGSMIDPNTPQLVPELTVLNFFCNYNFELSGGAIAVCAGGLWLGGIPICNEVKRCTFPLFPGNGTYTMVGSVEPVMPGFSAKEKDTIKFSCSSQFQLVGTDWSTCSNGLWTSAPPVCVERKGCVVPNVPDKGSMSLVGAANPPVPGWTIGEQQTLIFTCDPGYQLIGKDSMTCFGGEWTAQVPYCVEKKGCVVPNPPDNGGYLIIGSPNPPSPGVIVNEKETLQFTCQPGFQLLGKEWSTCSGGKWTFGTPVCRKIKYCTLPEFQDNGSYVIIGSANTAIPGSAVEEKETIKFVCNSGFKLVGSDSSTCFNNIWTSEVPKCVDSRVCVIPDPPEKGCYKLVLSATGSNAGSSVGAGSILEFTCQDGFVLTGDKTSTCVGGKWTTKVPLCSEKTGCVVPEPPAKGIVALAASATPLTPGSILGDSSIIQFTCDYGLVLIGEAQSTCSGTQWSSEVPKCEEKTGCVVPEPPAKGIVALAASATPLTPGSILGDSSIIQFTCDYGLVLIGEAQSTCSGTQWSSEVPKCVEKNTCVIPNPPTDGKIVLIGSTSVSKPGDVVAEWSTLKFECKAGFELVGKETSTCAGGKWSFEVPRCVGKTQCVLPALQSNGKYQIQGSETAPTPGQTVQASTVLLFSCDASYTLVGAASTTCVNDHWSNEVPNCVPQKPIEDCSCLENSKSGVYLLQPAECATSFNAYCDMDLLGGKWTVIQSRFNGSVDFFKTYQEYTDGFGLPSGEHWLGLEKIYQITKENNYELYVDLEAFNGERKFARYFRFDVSEAKHGYRLKIKGYSGTAGDSLDYHNYNKFSAHDKDQDDSDENCAAKWKGGWWYNNCHYSHLNGVYYPSAVSDFSSMYWYDMYKNKDSLKSTRMLIRKNNH